MPDLKDLVDNAAPSTLADVIEQVRDAFSAMADTTTIQIGKAFLEKLGVGSPPRIIFVPEADGSLGPPLQTGNAASVTHGCQVYVHATAGGTGVERFNKAYALGDKVIGCLAVAASGRIAWGNHGDGSPSTFDANGAALIFGFRYTRDVPHCAERWALSAAPADTTPPQPAIPPGQVGSVDTVSITVTPEE